MRIWIPHADIRQWLCSYDNHPGTLVVCNVWHCDVGQMDRLFARSYGIDNILLHACYRWCVVPLRQIYCSTCHSVTKFTNSCVQANVPFTGGERYRSWSRCYLLLEDGNCTSRNTSDSCSWRQNAHVLSCDSRHHEGACLGGGKRWIGSTLTDLLACIPWD